MPRRLLSLVLAAVLATVPSVLPARADCCDDAWSCIATIATGGLSCKAQQIAAAIEGTKKLIAVVEKTKAGFRENADEAVAMTQKDVGSASNTMKSDLQKSLDDIKKSVGATEIVVRKQTMQLSPHAGTAGAGAAAMAPAGAGAMAVAPTGAFGPSGAIAPSGPTARAPSALTGSAPAFAGNAAVASGSASAPAAGGTGGGATMPYNPPADPERMRADLKRALDWVEAADKFADSKQAPIVRSFADEAPKQVKLNEPPARKTVEDRLLNPLGVVLKHLENILAKILNPFDISSVTKFVDAEIKQIQAQAPSTFDMMGKQLSSDAQDRLMAGQKTLDDVSRQATDVRKVADQARRLAESGKKSDLDKLEELIGKPPSSMAMVGPAGALGGAVKAPASSSVASVALLRTQGTTKVARARAESLSAGLSTQWAATRKLLPAGPVAITPAMQKQVSDDLAKRFAGKSYPDARKAQQQLLDEARVKFANDPKTLAAVERYLRAQTSPLISAASAPIRR
jgi:hypothetical protein